MAATADGKSRSSPTIITSGSSRIRLLIARDHASETARGSSRSHNSGVCTAPGITYSSGCSMVIRLIRPSCRCKSKLSATCNEVDLPEGDARKKMNAAALQHALDQRRLRSVVPKTGERLLRLKRTVQQAQRDEIAVFERTGRDARANQSGGAQETARQPRVLHQPVVVIAIANIGHRFVHTAA